MKTIHIILLCYIFICSLACFIAFGADKKAAVNNSWRIPEATLLTMGFIGGALGGLIGMSLFRHKTQKIKFKLLMPLFLIFNIAAATSVFVFI
ncbi:MAG: DUF1294 domain-containing protein [Clostridia bacterium]|nr:DUF1294 domain-containing protein [Clostridia bacterium]